jgi:ankyrin repeat protein
MVLLHGANVNAANKRGQTPLHTAASLKKDYPELCESLLEHSAKIDAMDKDGNQTLHLACEQMNVETGNLLVSYGADVLAINSNGHSPLYLLKKSISLSKIVEKEPVLHFAVRHEMVATVQLLVDCGESSNTVSKCGQTPLHVAALAKNDCPV